jgi:hypothetical protein
MAARPAAETAAQVAPATRRLSQRRASGYARGVLRKALPTGLLVALLLAHPAGFAAVPRQVRLQYERQEGAAACPDEASIRTGVAARLGYDPFRAAAEDAVRATVRQSGNQLEARIELRDGLGNLRAERRLVSRRRDCSELAASVELSIAIAIDPFSPGGAGGPPAADPAAPARADAAQAEPPQLAPASPAEFEATAAAAAPLTTWLAVAVLGGVGFAPAPNAGLLVAGGIGRGRLSLALEGRADLPAAKGLVAGEASASLLAGSLVPCLHIDRAAVCALATAGARRVAGHDLIDARSATLPYLGLGGRLGVAFPMGERLAFGLHGDVTAPLTRTRLEVSDGVVWTSPTLAVTLALGLAMRFP